MEAYINHAVKIDRADLPRAASSVSSLCLSPNGLQYWRSPAPPLTLLIATVAGVVRLERRARAWQRTGASLDQHHLSALLREPVSGALFAGAHSGGLYRSLDGGLSWSAAMRGLEHLHVFCLACVAEPTGPAIYAGTEPAHLYRSRDLGASWQQLTGLRCVPGCGAWSFPAPPHAAHVKHVAGDPRDPQRLFVCIEQGALLLSEDGGESFRELHFQDATFRLNRDTHRVVFNPHRTQELCLVSGEGISRSRDGGRSWQRLGSAPCIAYPDAFCYSPEEAGVMYVAGAGTTPDVWRQTGDAAAAIACSRDDGRCWAQLRGGLPRRFPGSIEALSLCSWPGGFGFFAATTDGEVFHSADRGGSWECLAQELPPVSKCIHYRNLSAGRERALEVLKAGLQAMRL